MLLIHVWLESRLLHFAFTPTNNSAVSVAGEVHLSVKGQKHLQCVCYLRRQQSVGVEALHVGDQVVLGVDHILDEHAVEKEPVGPAVHRDAFWDFTVTQPPHVGVALKEQTIQTLLTDKPGEHTPKKENDQGATISSYIFYLQSKEKICELCLSQKAIIV